jgi:hypothetical protein
MIGLEFLWHSRIHGNRTCRPDSMRGSSGGGSRHWA